MARKYTVSTSWVRRVKQRRAATGETARRSSRHRRVGFRQRHADALRAAVAADSKRTLAELRAHLGGAGQPGHPVAGAHRPENLLEEKAVRAAEQDRPDVKATRDEWKASQPSLDPDRLVFVDETWASTNMHRTHGRCPRGERLVSAVPAGHWKTTTFVAALRADGMVAPTVIDGPVTGDLFVAWVEQQLARRCGRGTWWCWTTWPATSERRRGGRWRRPGRRSPSCHRTRPT